MWSKEQPTIAEQRKKVYGGVKRPPPYDTFSDKTDYATSSDPTFQRKNKKKDYFDELMEDLRKKIRARGIRGIMSVRRAFFMADENDSKNIDFEEFTKLFKKYKFKVDESQMKDLFKHFDKDNSNTIEYNEFLDTILGEINPNRMKLIQKVYRNLDEEDKGYVTLNEIRKGFNPAESPKVRSGIKNENEVLGDFIDLVEYHFNLLKEISNLPVDKSGETMIYNDDFVEFFRNISFPYEEDKEFEVAISAEWGLKLKGKYPYQRGWNKSD